LKLHVVHHHHGLHQSTSSSSSSGSTGSSSSSSTKDLQQQQGNQEPWPWVTAMLAAAKDGSFEEQLQPQMHSSMSRFVKFKEGIIATRLVVPKQPSG
jgi:hypothetical protein